MRYDTNLDIEEAFRWTAGTGLVGLGDLPGGRFWSTATAVSADGSLVGGQGYSDYFNYDGFLWKADTGMVPLVDRPGFAGFDTPLGFSGDGSIVVGMSGSGTNLWAFIWDAEHGLRRLDQVLGDLGLDLTGWTLERAHGISADGRVIVGMGINPSGQREGWLAVAPRCGDGTPESPETCDDANTITGDGCSLCSVEAGFTCTGTPSVCVPLAPAIEVTPRQYDFGQVDLGTSSTQIVTISNTGAAPLVVDNVALLSGSGLGFSFTGSPSAPFEIEPNATVDLGLSFAPVDAGAATATLRVTSNDPEEPLIEVPLTGFGVSYDEQAMALLTFFDELVAGGDLVGEGPGNSASGRLNALRNMIEASGDLIEQGRTAEACDQLEDARRRTDGLFPPPDFASGPAAPDLEAEIAQLRSNLRCDVPQVTAGCGLGAELALVLPPLLALRRRRRGDHL